MEYLIICNVSEISIIKDMMFRFQADKEHHFSLDDAVQDAGVVNYVRLTILPDGGISRMILNGHIVKELPNHSAP